MIFHAEQVKKLFELMTPVLDERTERLLAAAVATSLGHGGTATVTAATGIRSKRIAAGKRDLREIAASPDSPLLERVRRPGGGRKSIEVYDPKLAPEGRWMTADTTSRRASRFDLFTC